MVENFDEWFHDILEKANITDSILSREWQSGCHTVFKSESTQ